MVGEVAQGRLSSEGVAGLAGGGTLFLEERARRGRGGARATFFEVSKFFVSAPRRDRLDQSELILP